MSESVKVRIVVEGEVPAGDFTGVESIEKYAKECLEFEALAVVGVKVEQVGSRCGGCGPAEGPPFRQCAECEKHAVMGPGS